MDWFLYANGLRHERVNVQICLNNKSMASRVSRSTTLLLIRCFLTYCEF